MTREIRPLELIEDLSYTIPTKKVSVTETSIASKVILRTYSMTPLFIRLTDSGNEAPAIRWQPNKELVIKHMKEYLASLLRVANESCLVTDELQQ